MECIVFTGVQACGKTSFYSERFRHTHMRINLDMLKSRHRENCFLQTCIQTQTPFVVDNTNPRREDRQRYITMAAEARYVIHGFYFQSRLADALERNRQRPAAQRISDVGVRSTYAKLEIPCLDEGFTDLYYVEMNSAGGFEVKEWSDEV